MAKLALTMIIKDDTEAQGLARCLDTVARFVDGIFITGTNKPDTRLEEITKSYGGSYSYFKWEDDFAKARNFNLSQVTPEYKYVLWIDADDVLMGGEKLKDIVDAMERGDYTAAFMMYNYEINPTNNAVVTKHPRERVVRKDFYEWKGLLHETLIPKDGMGEQRILQVDTTYVNHLSDVSSSEDKLARNVRILEKSYLTEEVEIKAGTRTEHDPRTEFHLARCYYDLHTQEADAKCEQLLYDYLAHSGWDEERCLAWNYLGEIYLSHNKIDDAISAFLSALKESDRFPATYINLGVAYVKSKQWDKAIRWTERGLSVEIPETTMVMRPQDEYLRALENLFFAYRAQRKFYKAKDMAEQLVKLFPAQDQFKTQLDEMESLIYKADLGKSAYKLLKHLKDNGEAAKAPALLGSLPDAIQDNAFVAKLRNEFLPTKEWGENSVVIFCGPGFEDWGPSSLSKGIGGSEEAVINLSKQFTKQGYKVTVYGSPGTDEGVNDGVEYLNYWRFNSTDAFNIFIGWRNPRLFENFINAKKKYIDLHDVPNPGEFTETVLKQLDKIFVKSAYHRSFLPEIPDDKFVIVGNGIDLHLFDTPVKRNPKRLIYTSSYDRGLEKLLKLWPAVKAEVPDAVLDIFYGWNLFDKFFSNNPAQMMWKDRMIKLMAQDGVTEHGRISQAELVKEMMRSAIFAYYCTFEEIDCISAKKAQAAGSIPVVTNYAALKGTVQHGIKVLGDPQAKTTQEDYKNALVKLLKDQEGQEETRKVMVPWAKDTFGWEKVAQSWVETFREEVKTGTPKISVITVTNRKDATKEIKASLDAQTFQDFEWIVVDDSAGNPTKRNYSICNANNRGWKQAKGELLVYVQDFTKFPKDALAKFWKIHLEDGPCMIAGVDERVSMETGELEFTTPRIRGRGVRESEDPFDFEMNYAAISKKILDELGGWYEFMDEGIGYDNTQIAFRALKKDYKLFVDQDNKATALNHWNKFPEKRDHNLNDPRYDFLTVTTDLGKLPLVRDEALDSKLELPYKQAQRDVKWIVDNTTKLTAGWIQQNKL